MPKMKKFKKLLIKKKKLILHLENLVPECVAHVTRLSLKYIRSEKLLIKRNKIIPEEIFVEEFGVICGP